MQFINEACKDSQRRHYIKTYFKIAKNIFPGAICHNDTSPVPRIYLKYIHVVSFDLRSYVIVVHKSLVICVDGTKIMQKIHFIILLKFTQLIYLSYVPIP